MTKKESLKRKMNEYIDTILKQAESQNQLDFLEINISNHNGNLQMDCKFKNRKKAY